VQFTYVLKGWVEFEYAGVGKVTMRAGTCFYQPPNLPHRELRHSKNLELLEVVAPARFETLDAPPPAAAAARKATRRTPTRAARRR
jgi:mannose-6-phosphate isomerase-like protein (cupin superfamily)